MGGANQSDETTKNLGAAQSRLLGPDYDYGAQIRPPSGPDGLGMSSDGTFGALESDITGLMDYVKVLLTGQGASKTGRPLGTKFFLDTDMKCTDKSIPYNPNYISKLMFKKDASSELNEMKKIKNYIKSIPDNEKYFCERITKLNRLVKFIC